MLNRIQILQGTKIKKCKFNFNVIPKKTRGEKYLIQIKWEVVYNW